VIVNRGHYFLIFPEPEASVEKPEAHRGAVSQRDFGGIHREILSGGVQDRHFLFFFLFKPVANGIGIKTAAMPLDGLAH
jgi:hypothetical protein